MSNPTEEYRHKVEVNLALCAVNLYQPSLTRFVLRSKIDIGYVLPNRPLGKGQSSYEIAKGIFKDMTGSDPSWFTVKQTGMFDGVYPDKIVVLYTIMMPDMVPLLDSQCHWVDFDTLRGHSEVFQLIGHGCNYYKMS